ncbi:MAG TPA: hypothetical protein VGD31_16955 [Sphingobacteriaceae bacterium]
MELELTKLQNGLPGITPTVGAALVEACCVCLRDQGHLDGVSLVVEGTVSRIFNLRWFREHVTEQVLRCWKDMQEATEDAAACIACLLVLELTEFTIIERSRKGTGFDYWLGYDEDEPLFQPRGRLEVSGILAGSERDIKERVKKKIKQTAPSDHMQIPALAIVVEFSRPISQVATK